MALVVIGTEGVFSAIRPLDALGLRAERPRAAWLAASYS